MTIQAAKRTLIAEVAPQAGVPVVLRGWIHRFRALAKNTFIVLRDCSGQIQCVADAKLLANTALKAEDTVEISGIIQIDARAKLGYEVLIERFAVLNAAGHQLPFVSTANANDIGSDVLLEYRPLALRTELYTDVFRIQAGILRFFREYLTRNYFTEVVTSKIVASGTEGGTNLFEIKYFERTAFLAQSPQFYKEECVGGLERVFETGHVYRAEPHASSRHLTEYCSLDLEFGFIDGPEDVIALERDLLTYMFEHLNLTYDQTIRKHYGDFLPSMEQAATWEFSECLDRLKKEHGRDDLFNDLDPEAERQLCSIARRETGVSAVFVLGFPLNNRPFYTLPRGSNGAAQSFDLLFDGLEITTGGQRHHSRAALEAALIQRRMRPADFESHLKAFDLGMPPHGGLAIGLERLTAQIMRRGSVKETTLYPRDRYRLTP